MKNTKYIKVSVSELLPDTAGYYFIINRAASIQIGYFNGRTFAESFIDPEYWLLEAPDYENEMKEMLIKVDEEQSLLGYVTSDTHSELDELLTKLKTES